MSLPERNWAGNVTYSAADIHVPATVAEVQQVVRASSRVRALGSRHSFNGIADSPRDIISLAALDRVIALDRERRTVTIEGGVHYGQLGEYLYNEGFALHDLASLPHISVAGAVATASHGSGKRNGNLAIGVSAMELVVASGALLGVSRELDGDRWHGMPVSLGALGVITSLTLDLVPAFDVQQDVYDDLPFHELLENLDAIEASAYSVSLFTDWRGAHINQVWLKRRVPSGQRREPEPTFFGGVRATENRHPLPGISPVNCTEQMGIPGPWYARLPHFRLEFRPSSSAELQSEYFVPRQHAVAALRAISQLGAEFAPHLLISEIRAVAADELWMSPCYMQDCLAIHFTWKQDWPAVQKLLALIEWALEPFEARPHWGKLFTMQPERVQSLYERLPDFRKLVRSYDLQGKFQNEFLKTYVMGMD